MNVDGFRAADFYENVAPGYDLPVNRDFYQAIASQLLEAVPADREITTIFEVGAGTGFATEVLRRRFPRASLTAVEPSSTMASHGRRRAPSALWSTTPISRTAPLEADLVMASMSYHWLGRDERTVLARAARSGILAVAVAVNGGNETGEKSTVPNGNSALRKLVYKMRSRPAWTKSDRRAEGIGESLRRSFSSVRVSHVFITETFPNAAALSQTLYDRGTLLALFSANAAAARRELGAVSLDARAPVSFMWKIALIVAYQAGRGRS